MASDVTVGTGARKRLARRVALASALAAALGGAAAAVASGTAAGSLLAAHDDDTLRTAAARLADEVRDEVEEEWDDEREAHGGGVESRSFATPLHDGLTGGTVYLRALLDELDEVEDLPGVRARLDDAGGGLLAGDLALPHMRPGTCDDASIDGAPLRVCAVPAGAGSMTLAMASGAAEARSGLLAWSVLAGVLIGALLGGLVSHRASVWALRPLLALSARVREVQPADPRPEVLGAPLEHVELEEVRASVAQLVVQLGEALASARGFAAQAAHELRTPLASLVGELELLAETASPQDSVAIGNTRRRAADLVSLVQRLLILAQPDAIALAQADAVDLGDVLEAARENLTPERRDRLRVTVQDDVLVRGDAALLTALLTNALDNALKFSTESVAVNVHAEAGEALIDVADRGPGIPLEERERVFEPFYRSRAARQSTTLGHGVGLALIAHVAKAHGGRVSLASETGEGTRLTVRLPTWKPRTESSRG